MAVRESYYRAVTGAEAPSEFRGVASGRIQGIFEFGIAQTREPVSRGRE